MDSKGYEFVTQHDVDEVIYQRPGKREKVLRKLLAERDAYREVAIREHGKLKMQAYTESGTDVAAFVGMPAEFLVDTDWLDAEARGVLTQQEKTK